MYVPTAYAETDVDALHALIAEHPLATVVTQADGELTANHVPLFLDPERGRHGTLVGHVARPNPLWRSPGPALAVFTGPDAYISPSWYPGKAVDGKVVPTWNYSVVHGHGTLRAVDDPDAVLVIITRLTEMHEGGRSAPWSVTDAPADFVERMLRAIVGIEIDLDRIDGRGGLVGKSKLSQNRPAEDRAAVIAGLRSEGSHSSEQVAARTPR